MFNCRKSINTALVCCKRYKCFCSRDILATNELPFCITTLQIVRVCSKKRHGRSACRGVVRTENNLRWNFAGKKWVNFLVHQEIVAGQVVKDQNQRLGCCHRGYFLGCRKSITLGFFPDSLETSVLMCIDPFCGPVKLMTFPSTKMCTWWNPQKLLTKTGR